MAPRGRQAMSFEEKVEKALEAEATTAQSDFIAWLNDVAPTADVDERTVILVQKLYPEFLKTPEAESAREERKAEAAKAKEERDIKALDNFRKRAEKLGFKLEKVAEDDAE